jgi:predicted dehydrogenase
MSLPRLRAALLGYGYWGPNLLRNMRAGGDFDVVAVADPSSTRLEEVSALYDSVATYSSQEELFAAHDDIVLTVIATPPMTHFELGMRALRAGTNILMAKPLATTLDDAYGLIDAAARLDRQVFVDHTYVYTPAVRELRRAIEAGELGTPLYYSSVRVNLGLFQPDASVIWDLMPHDLSIVQALFGSTINRVSATAHAVSGYHHWDIGNATIWLSSGLVAFVNVSWMAPTKLRTILIGGSQRSAVYDDLEATEKLRIYDKGVLVSDPSDVSTRRELLVQYRLGDVRIPHLDGEEALARELRHVAACLRGEETPQTGGDSGVEVVAAIEAMERSARLGGAAVDVSAR